VGRLQGAQILLVEDTQDTRDAFAVLLEAEGAEVVVAGSGLQAINIMKERDFDLLLTDLGLPDVPGDVVIRAVKASARRCPWVVVVTGHGEPFISRARQEGADVVLTKPITWPQLLDRLEAVGRGAA
jgi:two-component system, chemotaxis family, CheB/CheR fusion protein